MFITIGRFRIGLPTLALAITAALSALAAWQHFTPLDLSKLEGAALGSLLLSLVFVALVIERATEVFINNTYGPDEARLFAPQRQLEQTYADTIQAIDNETARARGASLDTAMVTRAGDALDKLRLEADRLRNAIADEKRSTLEQRLDLAARKGAAASAFATIVGAAVAMIGPRVLAGLTEGMTEAMAALAQSSAQRLWFDFVDVTLTALLLAGGAEGIHQIYRNFLPRRADIASAR